jgi:hypothetical protein
MKKLITLSLVLMNFWGVAQQENESLHTGFIGVGLHWACPQSELKDIEYNDGLGLNISYLSNKIPDQSPINFQWGVRMDFARLGAREFDDIIIMDGDVELEGGATVTASNRMYGLFASGRINFAPEGKKVTPYMDLLVGHRNYTTHQLMELNSPGLNQEYEASTETNRIVHTKRFHYGGSAGISYQVSPSASIETSITYTFGKTGAALPLQDIERMDGSNEIRYAGYQRVKTDILLINVGLQIHLFDHYAEKNTNTPTSSPTYIYPENTRYKDTRPPGKTPISPQENTNSSPVKKKTPKVKSDGPKRDPNAKG